MIVKNDQQRLVFTPQANFPANNLNFQVKFAFSKKVTKIDEIFTVDLTL